MDRLRPTRTNTPVDFSPIAIRHSLTSSIYGEQTQAVPADDSVRYSTGRIVGIGRLYRCHFGADRFIFCTKEIYWFAWGIGRRVAPSTLASSTKSSKTGGWRFSLTSINSINSEQIVLNGGWPLSDTCKRQFTQSLQ